MSDAPIADNPSNMYCQSCRSVGLLHCSDPQNCGGMAPMSDALEMMPCPFCGGDEFRIEAGGQTWRGVKGYSEPQYWHLYHSGTIAEGDGFQMCSVKIRARTEAELHSIWNAGQPCTDRR